MLQCKYYPFPFQCRHGLIWASRGGETSGLLDLAEGHVERAQENFERALEASQKIKPLGVQTGVLHYRVATAALKQKQKQTPHAMLVPPIAAENLSIQLITCISTHLRKSLDLAHTNEEVSGGKGEIARTSWLLAKALRMDGQEDEARKLHRAADEVRKAIQGAEYEEMPDAAESYDCLISGHYR